MRQQINGKGDFHGQMLQEVQPRFQELALGESFSLFRSISLMLGNSLFVIVSLFSLWQANTIIDILQHLPNGNISSANHLTALFNKRTILGLLTLLVHLTLLKYLFTNFAKMLTNLAHLFFAEMQFKSLLVYFKCEGTFTESKISTGKGIYDSTQSENTLIRSSITPWIIASNITSARDLGNTSQIHQLNQQTRAMPNQQNNNPQIHQDAEAAGYLQQEHPEAGPNVQPETY